MAIVYRVNHTISLKEFIQVLESSTLAPRRPMDDPTCLQGMLDEANLTITAWQDQHLVGIARCVTDFHYCCYVSDLAVDAQLQGQGVGKKLLDLCVEHTRDTCKIILLASPAANGYYPKIGMHHMDRCWILNPNERPQ